MLTFRTKKSASLMLYNSLDRESAVRAWLFFFIIHFQKLLKFAGFFVNPPEIRNCGAVIFDCFLKNGLSVFYYLRPFFVVESFCTAKWADLSAKQYFRNVNISQTGNDLLV